jgi:hypothetical protein
MLPSDRQGPRRRVAFQGSRLHPDASASQGLPNRGLGRYKTLPGSGPAWRAATARFRAGNSGPARPSAPSSARCPIFRRWLESTGTVPTDRRAASRLPLPSGPRRSQVRVPSRPDGPGGWVKSGSALVGRLTAGDAAQNRRADLHTTRRPDRPNSSRSALTGGASMVYISLTGLDVVASGRRHIPLKRFTVPHFTAPRPDACRADKSACGSPPRVRSDRASLRLTSLGSPKYRQREQFASVRQGTLHDGAAI